MVVIDHVDNTKPKTTVTAPVKEEQASKEDATKRSRKTKDE